MPIDLKDIRTEIEAGLPNSSKLRDDARRNIEFAQMQFDLHRVKNRDGRYQTDAIERYSPLMRRIVDILCGMLYKQQPTRKLADATATTFLERVYKRNKMAPKWKNADGLSLLGGYSAFQFAGDDDPSVPVKVHQWGPDQLVAWKDPEDPTRVAAVATIDTYDNGKRLRAWTRDKVLHFERMKGKDHAAFGSAAWKYQKTVDNPYRSVRLKIEGKGEEEGILPFSFTHWFYPCTDFEMHGPGDLGREWNDHLNRRLTNLGDGIEYQSKPIGVVSGDEGWHPPTKIKPGDFLKLPPGNVDAAGNGPPPSLDYVTPPLEWVGADWADLNNSLDHFLEMIGLPPAVLRMVQTSARSGLSIQMEQLPLLTWTEGRRPDWSDYEEEAALTCCSVAEAHLRSNGAKREADQLQGAIQDWSYSHHWPSLYTQLPGPDRDRADEWRMEQGLTNKVQVLMERDNLTEDEAFDALAKIKEQNDRLVAMGIDPAPAAKQPPAFGGFPGAPDMMTGEGPQQGEIPPATEGG